MAKYTIELRTIVSKGYNLFNFDYDFYSDDETLKKDFEEKFINRYYFNEIGFETVARFKHRLKTILVEKMPYYKQIYNTELEAKKINFLLNKDLLETHTRELKKQTDNNIKDNSTLDTMNTINTTQNDINKESNLDNGVGSVELSEGNLTSISSGNTIAKNDATTQTKNISLSEIEQKDTEIETNTILAQGNIGVTSSAQLLKEWRGVIINIDEMLINELEKLFMILY